MTAGRQPLWRRQPKTARVLLWCLVGAAALVTCNVVLEREYQAKQERLKTEACEAANVDDAACDAWYRHKRCVELAYWKVGQIRDERAARGLGTNTEAAFSYYQRSMGC